MVGITLAIVLLVRCCAGVPCQRTLGKICLGRDGTALAAEVERLFEAKLQFRESDKYDQGNSTVDKDGTPVIELNPKLYGESEARQETAAVHELFHLRMRGLGYPVIGFENNDVFQRNQSFFESMNELVFSPIEHYVFYPAMRKMALDPGAGIDHHFATLELRTDQPVFNNSTSRKITMMRVDLECREQTIARLEDFYRGQGWENDLIVGKELAKIVRSSKYEGKDDEIGIFIACVNRLIDGQGQVELVGWENHKYGRIVYRAATIRARAGQRSRS